MLPAEEREGSSATPATWIDVVELPALVTKKDPLIVDLRSPGEFHQGHLPGAVSIPIEELSKRQDMLDRYRQEDVLLYCRTVNKSAHGISILQARGFISLYALQDGYEAYRIRPLLPPVPESKHPRFY